MYESYWLIMFILWKIHLYTDFMHKLLKFTLLENIRGQFHKHCTTELDCPKGNQSYFMDSEKASINYVTEYKKLWATLD